MTLEATAEEGYRSGHLTETQVMHLLELPSRFAVHEWLRDRGVPYRYTEADFADDLRNLTEPGLH
jgi:predicted HTH domain antitoxin